MTVTGRGEETASALVTVDMMESFVWTVPRDISARRGTTLSPCVKVNSTDYRKIIKASLN